MLARALRLYQATWLQCLPLALLGTLLATWASAYANARTGAVAERLFGIMGAAVTAPDSALQGLDETTAALNALWHSPSIWASYLGALLIGVVFHGALIARQHTLTIDASAEMSAPGRPRAAAAAAPQWLALTLRRLPSLALALVLLAVASAVGVELLQASGALGAAAAVLVVLAVPSVATWVWGRLQLWLVAMFAQDLGALDTLRASWKLVRGHWWWVSTVVSVGYLAIFLLSTIAAWSAGAWAATLVNVATLPLLPALWLTIYRQLRSGRAAQDATD